MNKFLTHYGQTALPHFDLSCELVVAAAVAAAAAASFAAAAVAAAEKKKFLHSQTLTSLRRASLIHERPHLSEYDA